MVKMHISFLILLLILLLNAQCHGFWTAILRIRSSGLRNKGEAIRPSIDKGKVAMGLNMGKDKDTISFETMKIHDEIIEEISIHSVEDDASVISSIPASKQPVLFLPGLDGSGDYSAESFSNLTTNPAFEVWQMRIDPADRNSFLGVAKLVLDFLASNPAFAKEPAILIGESFGGLLASYVSLRAPRGKIGKLVLINPATSYEQTSWPLLSRLVVESGSLYPAAGIGTLMLTAIQPQQIVRVGDQIMKRINGSTERAIDEARALLASGELITTLLPPDTLRHRLDQWLGVGAYVMRDKYAQVTVPTAVLVGTQDRLLPSKDEVLRSIYSLDILFDLHLSVSPSFRSSVSALILTGPLCQLCIAYEFKINSFPLSCTHALLLRTPYILPRLALPCRAVV
jgi:pimeloyl-ACP methyl ester carboxylesterase